jgi:hypothetical protein
MHDLRRPNPRDVRWRKKEDTLPDRIRKHRLILNIRNLIGPKMQRLPEKSLYGAKFFINRANSIICRPAYLKHMSRPGHPNLLERDARNQEVSV